MAVPACLHCDPAALFEAIGGQHTMFAQLVCSYTDTVPPLFARLDLAARAGDVSAYLDLSHQLRACTLMFCANGLTALLAGHEQQARTQQVPPAAAAMEQVLALAALVEAEIRGCLPLPGAIHPL